MPKILFFLIAICLITGCAKTNSENSSKDNNSPKKQSQFYKPKLITASNYSPEQLDVLSIVPARLNDYFDFSQNTKEVLGQLKIKVASRCEANDLAHSYEVEKIPSKLYIHEILSPSDLQILLRAPIICEISLNIYSDKSYYLQPVTTLSIATTNNQFINASQFKFAELEYEFDYDFFYNEKASLICDHFTYKYNQKDQPSTILRKVIAKIKYTSIKSYQNNSYSQLCSYGSIQNNELSLSEPFKVLYSLPTLRLEQKFYNLYKDNGIGYHSLVKQNEQNISEVNLSNPSNHPIQIRLPENLKAFWLSDNRRISSSLIGAKFKSNSTHVIKSRYLYFNIPAKNTVHLKVYVSKSEILKSCVFKLAIQNQLPNQRNDIKLYLKNINLKSMKPIELFVDSAWIPLMLPFATDTVKAAQIDSVKSKKLLSAEYQQHVFKKQKINLCK